MTWDEISSLRSFRVETEPKPSFSCVVESRVTRSWEIRFLRLDIRDLACEDVTSQILYTVKSCKPMHNIIKMGFFRIYGIWLSQFLCIIRCQNMIFDKLVLHFHELMASEPLERKKLGKGDLFTKTPLEFKKWQKYPCFENTVTEQNFGNLT